MMNTNVNTRAQSVKILDLVNLDTITQEQTQSLEAQGLCLMLLGGGGLVIPVAAYEAICDLMGGVE